MNLQIAPLKLEHIPLITDYWHNSTPKFLISLGVDIHKLPSPQNFKKFLTQQIQLPDVEKQSLALIWYWNNQPIGHCNVNDIVKNKSAYLHLHIWSNNKRKKGIGSTLVKMSVEYFFNNLQIKEIYSQPKASNSAPNKTLEKAGFSYLKTYKTIPGSINYEQEVNLWRIRKNN